MWWFKKSSCLLNFHQGNKMQNHVLFHRNVTSLWVSTEEVCCIPQWLECTSLLMSKEQAARQILTHQNCMVSSPYLFGGFLFGGICSRAVGKRKQVELATIFHHRVNLTQRNYQVWGSLNSCKHKCQPSSASSYFVPINNPTSLLPLEE